MVYIGIDLHRKRSQVAALDGNGELLFNRRVASWADELFKAIGDAGEGPVDVVFEATFGWGWLADMLAEAGIPAHMAYPLATKAISSARVPNLIEPPGPNHTMSSPLEWNDSVFNTPPSFIDDSS